MASESGSAPSKIVSGRPSAEWVYQQYSKGENRAVYMGLIVPDRTERETVLLALRILVRIEQEGPGGIAYDVFMRKNGEGALEALLNDLAALAAPTDTKKQA